ncbi:MAG: M14 family zinc carboxypeptidase [Bacteroidota bacterium]
MNVADILEKYELFKEPEITDRFFKHEKLDYLLKRLPSEKFAVDEVGKSEELRSLNLVTWGSGPVRIFLWSQMHGDEATGTMALFDLFNFLQTEQFEESANMLWQNCTLFMLPMVNPDGAERFTRRNALQIDINRDFLITSSVEARILKSLRASIQPHFGFNLHDQDTLWSVNGSLKPATLSYLAPSFDASSTINETRGDAMLVIAEIYKELNAMLPLHIGLFKDEYEPRAFGDNFQLAGTSTILIEAGGYADDYEKQNIRKYYFLSVIAGLYAIAEKTYIGNNIADYYNIPKNDKQIFHILIRDIDLDGMETSIGINYDMKYITEHQAVERIYYIKDIGDLTYCNAYATYSGKNTQIEGKIIFDCCANFNLVENGKTILSFTNGLLS